MMRYRCMAEDSAGKRRIEFIEAASKAGAAKRLREGGLRPVSITESAPDTGRKVRQVEVERFLYQLGEQQEAGIPMLSALSMAVSCRSKGELSKGLERLQGDVANGMEFWKAASMRPELFGRMEVGLIRAGEESGKLHEFLIETSRIMEFNRESLERTKAAFRYPVMVLVAVLGALAVVNWVVIPAFETAFASFGAQLPWITRMMVSGSKVLRAVFPALALASVGGFFWFRKWRRTDAGAMAIDRALLKAPLIGGLVRKSALGRFTDTFAATQSAGLPIGAAIRLAVGAAGNRAIEARLEGCARDVESSMTFGVAAKRAGVFDDSSVAMFSTLEEAGRLEHATRKCAAHYRVEVEREVKHLPAMIEPVLVAALGVIVLLLALGIFMPLWDLTSVAVKH